MAFRLGGQLGYHVLRALCRRPSLVSRDDDVPQTGKGVARLHQFFGHGIASDLAGLRVLDFGCGQGAEAIAAAQLGAAQVWGIDIQEQRLQAARELARASGVSDRCVFLNALTQSRQISELAGTIDLVFSLDSFEHCARPEAALDQIDRVLAPGGRLLISFGPPWKNPYGCHTRYFCRWPWIHLLFAEETVLAVRSLYRDDGARTFEEVEGGLNRMTLARFQDVVEASSLVVDDLQPIPLSTRCIDRFRFLRPLLTTPVAREYFTSVVLCRLTKPLRSKSRHTATETLAV